MFPLIIIQKQQFRPNSTEYGGMADSGFDTQEIGRRLYARRKEGVVTKIASVEIGDWKPSEHECHGNVTTWCERNPQHKPVRGWLFFDFDDYFPHVRFVAHSVIEDENGNLIDITPVISFSRYPFIRAEEDEEMFASLVEEQGVTEINYVK